MPWNSAQAIASADKVVSSASYYRDELRKPVYRGLVYPSFFPTPRRIRRPSHLNLFALGFRPGLMPSHLSSFNPAGQGRAGQLKPGQAAPQNTILGKGLCGLGFRVMTLVREQWSQQNVFRYRVRRGCYTPRGCGEAGWQTGRPFAIGCEGLKRRPPTVGGRPMP